MLQTSFSLKYLHLLFVIALLTVTVTHAQEATPQGDAAISFDNAIVTEITTEGVIVNGLTILIAPGILDDDDDAIEVGTVLDVDGVLRSDGTVVAVTIDILDDDDDMTATPTANVTATDTSTPTMTPLPGTPDTTPTADPTPPAPTMTSTVSDDDDGGVIIVVEGPVQQINVNVITIYNLDIVLERDAPALTVIRIGDIVRIEGILPGSDDDDDDNRVDLSDTVIVAVNITFISVEVVIVDGLIWRDSGDCTDAPPALVIDGGGGIEWLLRCNRPQNNNGGNRDGGNGGGGGGGGGGGDNDDDD
ncbi:MAG: hypothetical protein AAF653_03855 [Chloroflexota bacterium]